MSDYLYRFGGQFREMQRIMDQLQPQLRVLNTIPSSVREQMEQMARIQAQISLPNDYLSELNRLRDAILPNAQAYQLKAFAESENTAIREIVERQHQIEDLSRRLASYSDIYLPSQRVLETLASTEALLATSRLKSELIAVAIQPQIAFQEFAQKQLELASCASAVARANRIMVVESAADLLDDMSSGFELAALMYSVVGDVEEAPQPEVNIFSELTLELEEVDLEEQETDAREIVLESKPAQVAYQGGRIVHLVYNLNIEAEREGVPVIFKPTSKALYGCSIIPTHVATDENSFAEIVDHLYFLLYEGSGAASRLLDKCSQEDLEALWRLKHLRLGSRHDIDHGAAKEIENKNRQVGQAYRSLIGKVAPRSKDDWIRAQVTLYSQLIEMLETL